MSTPDRHPRPPLVARITAEIGTLAALMAAALALLAFAAIADEVMEGETHRWDEAVLRAFRNPADPADPLGPRWLEIMFVDITSLGSTTVLTLISLVVVGFLVIERKRATALLVVISVAGGSALSLALKSGFDRPRPDLVAHLVDVHTLSFPSGHAMLSAVTYLTLGALLARSQPKRRIRIYILSVAVLLTLMIGFSRIFLGVHWPTDVLAGWCVGSAWALLCWLVALHLQRKGDIEVDEPEGGG